MLSLRQHKEAVFMNGQTGKHFLLLSDVKGTFVFDFWNYKFVLEWPYSLAIASLIFDRAHTLENQVDWIQFDNHISNIVYFCELMQFLILKDLSQPSYCS